MAMCKALEKHGFMLEKTEEELYELVDAAMSIAAWRNPKKFQSRRDQIAKNLFALPEDVIGSCYERSHCTTEKKAVDQKTVVCKTDHEDKKTSGVQKKKSEASVRIVEERNKVIKKKAVDQKVVVCKGDEVDKKNPEDQKKKFETSKRKLEESYKKLRESARKTKVLDIAEMDELMKHNRKVKRPRFRR